MEYEFILTFALASEADPEQYLDALYKAGCDDAAVGIGKIGSIALDFTRESDSEENAVLSAIADVKKAIPGATLKKVTPDRLIHYVKW